MANVTEKRAFEVTVRGCEGSAVYFAEKRGGAKYLRLLDLWDAGWESVGFPDLKARRVPSLDRAPGLLSQCYDGADSEFVASLVAESDAVAAWNSSHPVGTPVVVRMDSGEVRHTATRSRASLLCGSAVVWMDGIASCYRLTHVEPCAPS
jgi:hypothetical protein